MKIPSGGTIGQSDTYPEVSLDELFDTINPLTPEGVAQHHPRRGDEHQGARRRRQCDPEVPRAGAAEHQSRSRRALDQYEPSFDQLLVQGAQTMQHARVAHEQLTELVDETDTGHGAIAKQSAALETSLGLLPGALTKSTTTFAGLRRTLAALTPLVNAAKPAVTELPQFATALEQFAAVSTPTMTALAKLISNTSGASSDHAAGGDAEARVAGGHGLPRTSSPRSTAQDSSGQLAYLREYTPDIIAALTNIGQISGYYDANGHYSRTEPFYGAYGISGGN